MSVLRSLSSYVFRPFRPLLSRLRRHRPALSEEEQQRERNLPPLPPHWNQDSRWYRGDFGPREGTEIEPLIHGDEYFSDLLSQLRQARERVTIAGWCLTSLFPLSRDGSHSRDILAEVLRDVSARAEVYVLLWSGAPALFEPNTKMVESMRRQLLEVAPDVHCELDRTAPFSHDHHQKAVTVDGRVAYVGGMDLTTFQGDRWDTASHRLRSGVGWHDVQARLSGQIVHDVEENFCQRWNASIGGPLAPIEADLPQTGSSSAQLVRTIPSSCYPSFALRGHFGIRHALLSAIERASRYIYLENQYLWDPEIVQALATALHRNAGSPDFRIAVVLPALAYTGRYDNDDHVRDLQNGAPGSETFAAYSLYATGPGEGRSGYRYEPIYVHAKVSIIDDEWFMIGSANLNLRGLATDSEIAVQSNDGAVARELRVRLWAEHLGLDRASVEAREPIELLSHEWHDRANELARRKRHGLPPSAGHLHPYELGRSPMSRILDRFQSASLEH
ncbi:MAG TPA: phospholipase D family protein [Chloroflexota bacterium]|nr:phospholipase D family protein [Chloroflexota bacterium]